MPNGKSKLELILVGKENRPKPERRILEEGPECSYGDPVRARLPAQPRDPLRRAPARGDAEPDVLADVVRAHPEKTPDSKRLTPSPSLRSLVMVSILASLAPGIYGQITIEQSEKAKFEGGRIVANDPTQPEGSRESAMTNMIYGDAGRAREEIKKVFEGSSGQLKRAAAEHLARYGDQDAFEYERHCLADAACSEYRHQVARILGNSWMQRYSPDLAKMARAVLAATRGKKWLQAEEWADLGNATFSLARIGDRKDWPLILEAARIAMWQSRELVEALGYIDSKESRQLLWDFVHKQETSLSCTNGHDMALALLALSRLRDDMAIDRYRQILSGKDAAAESKRPTYVQGLCGASEAAFTLLRHRDSGNFAETVLQVMGQEPEGPGTKNAWMALGLMHPDGYGKRVFDLAMSKQPHWNLVTTDRLYKAVMAIDPSLNDQFWRAYGVKEIQSGDPERALVQNGLGYLMFGGTYYWEGE